MADGIWGEIGAQSSGQRAQGTEGTERRAQGTGHRGHRAESAGHGEGMINLLKTGKKMKRLRIVLISVAVLGVAAVISCLANRDENTISSQPKNIILFIGDGMGVTQLTAAMSVAGAPLHMEHMPVVGLVRTSAYDRFVTNSPAAATAMATGIKTRSNMVGVAPDSTSVENIVEIASRNGLSTGVVSTSSVTHATPAAFVAHVPSRYDYEDIALYYLNGHIDVFMGGGLRNFTRRSDSLNLLDKLRESGYTVVTTPEELNRVNSGRLAGIFYSNHMPKVSEGRSISLSEMTRKAIEILSQNEKGFFLMVEGALIDFAGHDNDTENTIIETLDMDEAVGEAISFAASSGNTLVIVTGDHETGGMALTGGDLKERRVEAAWPTTGHTATMVPLFAFGAGAEKFGGVMENTELFERMIMGLGIK